MGEGSEAYRNRFCKLNNLLMKILKVPKGKETDKSTMNRQQSLCNFGNVCDHIFTCLVLWS